MKQLLFFVTILLATKAFGQITNGKASGITADTKKTQKPDTALQVIYADKLNQTPACFVNGRFIMNQAFSINPDNIANIEVLKVDTLIDSKLFHGQIHIKTKVDYIPKFITLTELKNKYTNLKGKSVVFMLDGNFVTADYDSYLIDENYLLTIIIDSLQTEKEKIDLGLIKLLSKTDENIKARKQIMLRGISKGWEGPICAVSQ
ncbi:MAG: hypothetical protein IPH58_17835 [Sphingobacteriales bacterium]|jgi:hypothetical protein|nr:hypothetical protein [Sphingobacteriales bacterium]